MRFHLLIKDREEGGLRLPPCQSITVGKLEFRRYTTIRAPFGSGEGAMPDQIYQGAVGEYSEADVAEFHEKVKHLIVRWGWDVRDLRGVPTKRLWRSAVHDVRMRGFFASPEDEPLALYLEVTPISMGVPAAIVGTVTPEQAAALQDAAARETEVRETDPTDAARRKRHGRAKGAGEGVDA